jgi:hypothetical protein
MGIQGDGKASPAKVKYDEFVPAHGSGGIY